jgi:hypothetical protein
MSIERNFVLSKEELLELVGCGRQEVDDVRMVGAVRVNEHYRDLINRRFLEVGDSPLIENVTIMSDPGVDHEAGYYMSQSEMMSVVLRCSKTNDGTARDVSMEQAVNAIRLWFQSEIAYGKLRKVVPVKEVWAGSGHYKGCSGCSFHFPMKAKFCPNCGNPITE